MSETEDAVREATESWLEGHGRKAVADAVYEAVGDWLTKGRGAEVIRDAVYNAEIERQMGQTRQ